MVLGLVEHSPQSCNNILSLPAVAPHQKPPSIRNRHTPHLHPLSPPSTITYRPNTQNLSNAGCCVVVVFSGGLVGTPITSRSFDKNESRWAWRRNHADYSSRARGLPIRSAELSKGTGFRHVYGREEKFNIKRKSKTNTAAWAGGGTNI